MSEIVYCKNCERLVNFSIRFKEYYDRIDVKTNVTEMKMETENEEPENPGEAASPPPAGKPRKT